MKPKMLKVAILIDDMYQTLDVWYTYLRLRESGIEPILVGIKKKIYKSSEQYFASSDASIEEINPQDFSAVIIPGGFAPYTLGRSKEITKFIQEMYNEGKIVAAICHGISLLASANILRGKFTAGFFVLKKELMEAGANLKYQEVVIDNKLITSSKANDLPEFCKKIINELGNTHLALQPMPKE